MGNSLISFCQPLAATHHISQFYILTIIFWLCQYSNPACDIEFWHDHQPEIYCPLDQYTMKTNIKRFVRDVHLMWHYTLQIHSPHIFLLSDKNSRSWPWFWCGKHFNLLPPAHSCHAPDFSLLYTHNHFLAQACVYICKFQKDPINIYTYNNWHLCIYNSEQNVPHIWSI